MLNVVLVDDKKDIVLGISAAVDWAARQVAVHGFFNGADALAYCIANPPDLVITDIRMPFMTGLELLEALKQHNVQTRTVLLTGYEDFAYAREAIRLGAVEYLTKPVRIEAIEELIDREKALAESRRAQQQTQMEQWQQYHRSLPALRRQWFHALPSAPAPSRAALQRQFAELQFALQPENLLAVTVELCCDDGADLPAENALALTRYAAANMGCEIFRDQFPCECIDLGGTRLVFLLNYAPAARLLAVYYRAGELCEELGRKCATILKTPLAGGIGSCAARPDQLLKTIQDAGRALEQNFFGGSSILSVTELPPIDPEWETRYPHTLQDQAVQQLRQRQLPQAQATMDTLFERLAALTDAEPARLREHLLSFLLRIFHECEMEQYLHVATAIEQFQAKRTLAQLREWFGCLTEYLKDQLSENSSQVAGGVHKVRQYIDEHYAEAITLKSMAALAYISPTYLSFSFKEVLGVNFNEYLTTVRMEHAKRLLASRQYRVYEVCEMVGYHDKKYFSDLFKKYTGVFPKEWK